MGILRIILVGIPKFPHMNVLSKDSQNDLRQIYWKGHRLSIVLMDYMTSVFVGISRNPALLVMINCRHLAYKLKSAQDNFVHLKKSRHSF